MAFIQFSNITKHFGGVFALNDVSLGIDRGECHGLMGENGAGKSTLGKVLAGIHRPDSGEISIAGKPVIIRSPADARAAGVGMVHQELAFCPDLSVAENLCMGRYPRRLRVLLSRSEMRHEALALLAEIGLSLDVRLPMHALSTAQEQLVQIASAVGTGAKILIFDEPTSSLAEPDAQRLFALVERLKAQGTTLIYVSHRMPEVFQLCDRFSVLRDGMYVGTLTRDQATENKVVNMMIGRTVEPARPQRMQYQSTGALLEVRKLSSPGLFHDISFDLRRGEILGFAGLIGSGRSEVAQAIFGLDRRATGKINLDGKNFPLGRVRHSMARGVALVPEDRKRQGLILSMGGRLNFTLAILKSLSRLGFLKRSREKVLAREYFAKLAVKTSSLDAPVESLSGGNQQKVVIAKWLARGAKVMIVDEPTRGVDVGAKSAIHAILNDLAGSGVGILLISSELPEVLGLSTRILVMRQGEIVGELDQSHATQERVLRMMTAVA